MGKEDIDSRVFDQLLPYARGHLARRRFQQNVISKIKERLSPYEDLEKGKTMLAPDEILRHGKWILRLDMATKYPEVLAQYCRLLILSLDLPKETNLNFTSMFLSKATISEATKLISGILATIPRVFETITGSKVSEVKRWQTFVHFLITFASANGWSYVRNSVQVQTILNGMCQKMNAPLYTESNYARLANSLFVCCNDERPLLSLEALNALFSVVFRPLRKAEEDEPLLEMFICRVLTCPAVVLHLSKTNLESLVQSKVLLRVLFLLRDEFRLIDSIEPQRTINLMGNIIQMGFIDEQSTRERIEEWTWVLGVSMAQCTEFAIRPGEKSSHNHFHPIFGHYKLPIDPKADGSLKNVRRQLQLLWSSRVVSALFTLALAGFEPTKNNTNSSPHKDISVAFSKLWKRLGGGTAGAVMDSDQYKEAPPTITAVVCKLYVSAISSMQHLKSDILSGLCHNDRLLRRLWVYLVSWGQTASPSSASSDPPPLTAALAMISRPWSPHAAPLQLFAEVAASVISILDEEEMYEKGVPFPVSDLVNISKFCNWFCFRSIWNGLIVPGPQEGNLFAAIHHLAMILYARDCRRPFSTDPKFWLSPDVKSSVIINEYEKKTPRGLFLMEKLSHCVHLRDRMMLFRKVVGEEKSNIEGPTALITIVRSRLVEDGYRHLASLTPMALKNTIRVKFINTQGLEEAGIDQDGVFKEFLELTLKEVFTPQLNLFLSTSAGVLYPSPTSFVHDNHLQLFQFIGRMLAKAVYEGIVVDVQLAPVLLSAVLGGRRLCAFDELAQLDRELYKNLTFVKRYDGDVGDLCLTFSTDDDFLGKVVTSDLIPGGRVVNVTNENRIDYIHRMAHHRVFAQTREQCKAFVSGLQSILHSQWLSIFAPHELQYLISGQSCDIDVVDLKKHVQYYGGFHGSHRLIKWLWSIIENDFSADERRLFLKFVTSCSRPPLLGFSYLEPPFSIRCVEVSDDQDQGDTLGSVLRGFLTLRKSHSITRLPTASTCFNLLKLPNYNKKSVLLTKLRYAIHAESGFELS